MVIRNGNLFYKSPVQQHSFNHPYQLGQTSGDLPSSAMRIELAMEAGDVIVVGTDGLFDNMYSDEILLWVTQEINQSSDPQTIAWRLAECAMYNSVDRSADTPFARACRENGGNHCGGKRDDITVIVALILRDYS